MQSPPWKNMTSLFGLRCQRWKQGDLSFADWKNVTSWQPLAHLSLAEAGSRASTLFAEWNRKEKETRNTQLQWLFTDVYWQQRSKETSLSSQHKAEHVPDICFSSSPSQFLPWLAPASFILTPMLAIQHLGQIPGLVKAGDKLTFTLVAFLDQILNAQKQSCCWYSFPLDSAVRVGTFSSDRWNKKQGVEAGGAGAGEEQKAYVKGEMIAPMCCEFFSPDWCFPVNLIGCLLFSARWPATSQDSYKVGSKWNIWSQCLWTIEEKY